MHLFSIVYRLCRLSWPVLHFIIWSSRYRKLSQLSGRLATFLWWSACEWLFFKFFYFCLRNSSVYLMFGIKRIWVLHQMMRHVEIISTLKTDFSFDLKVLLLLILSYLICYFSFQCVYISICVCFARACLCVRAHACVRATHTYTPQIFYIFIWMFKCIISCFCVRTQLISEFPVLSGKSLDKQGLPLFCSS